MIMQADGRQVAEGMLYTDLYELTMAQLYFRAGLHEQVVQFDHFFRSYPDYGSHQAGYCINAGMEWFLDWLQSSRWGRTEIDVLRQIKGSSGKRLFGEDFLTWLEREANLEGVTIRAIPEGRVVHPNVPLTVVQGPLAMTQILETALLNHLNYQTLIATKAARVYESGRGRMLLEFGMRRAQERGALAGGRAALIGGAHYTSNIGLSHILGFPPKGTHAHSMVQAFMALGEGELAAFRAYAEVYPDDCLLLVDTIDTLESGLPNAIKVFDELRAAGHTPVGIRLDSGDLAYLSIQSARMLDRAGFPDTTIVLSSNLDELVIWQIITQIQDEAGRYDVDASALINRLAFGVGTRLITSWGEPALGGVYKLVALKRAGEWIPAIKVSDSVDKIPNPGNKHVWRLYDRRGKATADLLGLEEEDPRTMPRIELYHPADPAQRRAVDAGELSSIEPLLVDIFRQGKVVAELPTIDGLRQRRIADVERLDPGVRRLVNPHIYHVSLSRRLSELKRQLIDQALNGPPAAAGDD
jgi:nicotinate phosphoribosyltransferase